MTAPAPQGERLHVSAGVAGADAHVIVSWPAGARSADVEEAIKAAAREAVLHARERIRSAPKPQRSEAAPCAVLSHGVDGWHCAVEGPHTEHRNAAGDVTW